MRLLRLCAWLVRTHRARRPLLRLEPAADSRKRAYRCVGCGLVVAAERGRCEELALKLAARVPTLEGGMKREKCGGQPGPLARVSRAIRAIENEPAAPTDLAALACLVRLSSYHFLHTFQVLTGVTPHHYLLRARLRRAAVRLLAEKRNIAEIALDCGSGDLSNFNRAFRAEFGVTPRIYRRTG